MIWLVSILLIVALSTIFVKWRFSYWKRKRILCIEPTSIFGSVGNPITKKRNQGFVYADYYKKFKQEGARHGGFYNMLTAYYVPVDLDVIKHILETDFDCFYERGFYYNDKDDPVSAHLFALGGEKWKTLRAKLSPAFTRAKTKTMFATIMQCAENMVGALDTSYSAGRPIDAKDITSRFAIDVIGSCALGLECNSFENDKAEFVRISKLMFSRSGRFEVLVATFARNFPGLARALRIKAVGTEISKFYMDVARGTILYRRKNGVRRNDAFQALVDLGDDITVEEIAAQCLAFFVAGYETSSSTLTFALYELAKNVDVQRKTREEVLRVMSQHDGILTYEAIEKMKYLGQVVDETLRMYPPITNFSRECTKDYKLPNSDIVIERGTRIVFPVMGIHHDEDYYPNPEKFDPNRFSDENRKKIKPFSYIPFSEGPRMCIGKRFGLMEVKIGLSVLLKNYSFVVNPNVPRTLSWNRFSLTLVSTDIIWLDLTKASA
ncbi:hypothetical protein RN001_010427 [Aquatica leii]|uniref:Cytochrome P450 n=1 Tax=Aquatica leii TaxID=1421715 RepID=A0AAN7S8K7_9COLE|nr:hypothetical protein RN001_010427 [Aquatica leii]